MWPTKWSTGLKDDKLLPDIGSVGVGGVSPTGASVGGQVPGSSPYSLPSFVSDHHHQQQQQQAQQQQQQQQQNANSFGGNNGVVGTVTSSSTGGGGGDPLYDTISTMTQAQSTSIYTPPLGASLGELIQIQSENPFQISQQQQRMIFIHFHSFFCLCLSFSLPVCVCVRVSVGMSVGSGSLTPLTPISMQDIKAHMLAPNGVGVDTSLQYQQGKNKLLPFVLAVDCRRRTSIARAHQNARFYYFISRLF